MDTKGILAKIECPEFLDKLDVQINATFQQIAKEAGMEAPQPFRDKDTKRLKYKDPFWNERAVNYRNGAGLALMILEFKEML